MKPLAKLSYVEKEIETQTIGWQRKDVNSHVCRCLVVHIHIKICDYVSLFRLKIVRLA